MANSQELSELDHEIVRIGKRDNADKELIIGAGLAIRVYDLDDKVQDYLDRNPDTSFKDLDDYIISLCPPLEIVDDDELDDEEDY